MQIWMPSDEIQMNKNTDSDIWENEKEDTHNRIGSYLG
jgi:hypothetical protein